LVEHRLRVGAVLDRGDARLEAGRADDVDGVVTEVADDIGDGDGEVAGLGWLG